MREKSDDLWNAVVLLLEQREFLPQNYPQAKVPTVLFSDFAFPTRI